MLNGTIQRLIDRHVVYFEDRWKQAHHQFSETVYPHAKRRRDIDYLKVKLIKRNSAYPNLLLAIDQDRVVGQLGLIEMDVVLGGNKRNGVWGVNLVVLPELNGAGFGGLLELRALQLYQNFLGFGVSPDSDKNQRKRNARILAGPRTFYGKLGDRHHLLFRRYGFFYLVGLLVKTASFCWGKCMSFCNQLFHWTPPQVILDPDLITADLLANASQCENKVMHDAEFFQWRLIQPVASGYKKYQLIRLKQSYVLADVTRGVQIVDFAFDSFWTASRLLHFLRHKLNIHESAEGVLVNENRHLLAFLLAGFLTTGKRKPVYVNGECKTDSSRFYLTGLDSDVSI